MPPMAVLAVSLLILTGYLFGILLTLEVLYDIVVHRQAPTGIDLSLILAWVILVALLNIGG